MKHRHKRADESDNTGMALRIWDKANVSSHYSQDTHRHYSPYRQSFHPSLQSDASNRAYRNGEPEERTVLDESQHSPRHIGWQSGLPAQKTVRAQSPHFSV